MSAPRSGVHGRASLTADVMVWGTSRFCQHTSKCLDNDLTVCLFHVRHPFQQYLVSYGLISSQAKGPCKVKKF